MSFPLSKTGRRTIILGGGFYGCCMAIFFRHAGDDVTLVETESQLLTRASYNNQARVHGGYHYPRSILTGKTCVSSFPLFAEVFRDCVVDDFTMLYAIGRVNSFITAAQFAGFCRRVGAPVREASPVARRLMDGDLIEEVFEAPEYAFNAAALRQRLQFQLASDEIEVCLESSATSVEPTGSGGVRVNLADNRSLEADQVFNCTFANINSLLRNSGLPTLEFRHELAEIALIEPPSALSRLGITVMDGPFFSTMPFPAEGLHSLTHVRYTPHLAWKANEFGAVPDLKAANRPESRFPQMLKDTVRYLPVMNDCRHVRSLFEIKTTLGGSERNDGRPILLKRNYGLPGLHIVMGGKIDNIFDILRSVADLREESAGENSMTGDDYFRSLFDVDSSRIS